MSDEPKVEGADAEDEPEAAEASAKKPKRGRVKKSATDLSTVRCTVSNVWLDNGKRIIKGEEAEVSSKLADELVANKQCERV